MMLCYVLVDGCTWCLMDEAWVGMARACLVFG